MSESLENVKKRLFNVFLGKYDIHGIGIDRLDRSIKVYVNRMPT